MLRCPNCGGGGLFASWFQMKERCPTCSFALERNEGEDYFIGGMMLNIVLAELVYAGAMLIWLLVTWPTPPWTLLQYVGIPLMVVAPFVLYPFSRTTWLAFDLMFRPATSEEFGPDA
jgi:Protein of unknown function (DUF983).